MYITDHNKMEIYDRPAPREENKWSGDSSFSPTPVSAVMAPPISAASYSYKLPERTIKFEEGKLIHAQLKSITQICNESPNAQNQDVPGVHQWKIFHPVSDKCLTVGNRFTKYFGELIWMKKKYHYSINKPGDRIIYKVYTDPDDRYAGFDVYDCWCEWIGERPKPLGDIEELFTI